MSVETPPATPEGKPLRVTLWMLQILLAATFGTAGVLKFSQPIDELAQTLPWVADSPAVLVRLIGVAELIGAIGLILPAATRILPIFTPFASLSLTVVMALAVLFHLTRKELAEVPLPLILGVLSGIVTWGRLQPAKIKRRRRRRKAGHATEGG